MKDVYQITFSPTGTSRRVAEAIVSGTGIECVAVADVTLETEKSLTVPRRALAVFAVPVYGGHVAPLALERMKDIRSDEGASDPSTTWAP